MCGRSASPSASAAGGGRVQSESADGTRQARHAWSRRAGGNTQCGRSALPPASAAWEGDCRARTVRSVSSRAIMTSRRQHVVWPLGAALRQRGWRGRLQGADGTRCARPARSRRAGGGTWCSSSARHSVGAAAAGGGDCIARTARGVLVPRDRDAPEAAYGAAAGRGPPPALLGRATAEHGRHAASSSRAIATCRQWHIVPPLGAVLRVSQRG